MKHSYVTIISLLVAISILGCKENFYYESNQVVTADQWSYQDSLSFTFAIVDTSTLYNLYLDIEHSTDYAYQNIYLQIATEYPSGKRIKEKLPINFSDKAGRWYGKCDSEWCNLRVNLQKDAFFNATGKHTIVIEQYMRVNPLHGIRKLSLKLEDTGRKRGQ